MRYGQQVRTAFSLQELISSTKIAARDAPREILYDKYRYMNKFGYDTYMVGSAEHSLESW